MNERDAKPRDEQGAPIIEHGDNTPPPSCIYCHTPMQFNAPGKTPAVDGIAWRWMAPKGSGLQDEDQGWTHVGECSEANKQSVLFLGMKVHPRGHVMQVSYDG